LFNGSDPSQRKAWAEIEERGAGRIAAPNEPQQRTSPRSRAQRQRIGVDKSAYHHLSQSETNRKDHHGDFLSLTIESQLLKCSYADFRRDFFLPLHSLHIYCALVSRKNLCRISWHYFRRSSTPSKTHRCSRWQSRLSLG